MSLKIIREKKVMIIKIIVLLAVMFSCDITQKKFDTQSLICIPSISKYKLTFTVIIIITKINTGRSSSVLFIAQTLNG